MNATNYLENKLVDHLFRATAFPMPAALWVALYTAAPSDAGGGTEVAGGGYVRVNLAPAATNWTATQGGTVGVSTGTGGATGNALVVTFPAPSADWGTLTHMAILDAATGGNALVWGALTTPRPVVAGDPAPRFSPGTLTVTVG